MGQGTRRNPRHRPTQSRMRGCAASATMRGTFSRVAAWRGRGRRAGVGGETAPGFGEMLRRHRLAAGLTQEALAERAGLSVRGLSDLERGARAFPHQDTVRMLADALGLAGAARAGFIAAGRRPRAPRPAAPSAAPPGVSLPPPTAALIDR